jgi:nitroimidazol reductase NimA-like FMN-containing flavoprotein (pyridoxamine 5'-phosphate oxidase superfamily)
MSLYRGVSDLSPTECRELLAAEEIGRVIATMGALPAAFPVSYRMIRGRITFSAAAGTWLAAAVTGAVVGFEADRIDAGALSGWSVMAVGRARAVDDAAVAAEATSAGLTSPSTGDRHHLLAIEPELLRGRRLDPRALAG